MFIAIESALNNMHQAVIWLADGCTVSIVDLEKFVNYILPIYFKTNSFQRFMKSLMLWGFKPVLEDVGNGNSFRHQFFRKNRYDLVEKIRYQSNLGSNRAFFREVMHKPASPQRNKCKLDHVKKCSPSIFPSRFLKLEEQFCLEKKSKDECKPLITTSISPEEKDAVDKLKMMSNCYDTYLRRYCDFVRDRNKGYQSSNFAEENVSFQPISRKNFRDDRLNAPSYSNILTEGTIGAAKTFCNPTSFHGDKKNYRIYRDPLGEKCDNLLSVPKTYVGPVKVSIVPVNMYRDPLRPEND